MTYTRAIKEINSRIEMVNRYGSDLIVDDTEALKMAIEALQKQEPMKPKVDGESGLCERCGYVFNLELISEYFINYCPGCGQKIDWTED